MIYRTSQRGTYRNINANLDLLSWRIAQLSNQVASEKKINKPSDNPSGAASVLRTRTVLSEIAQHGENVGYSNTWLTNTGNVTASIKSVLDEIYTKAEQGATDTVNGDQRSIIAEEVDQLFKTIIQFGDTRYLDNYLLAGQSTQTQPFTMWMKEDDVVPGCDNSDLWTGKIQNVGDQIFEARPDMPVQSQMFLVECVQPGGVDSRLYAGQYSSALAQAVIVGQGGEYSLTLTTTDQIYNKTKIRMVPGPDNASSTGAGNSLINYSASSALNSPVRVVYRYGTSAAPTAAALTGPGVITVSLQTNALGTASVATAGDVASAVNSLSALTRVTAEQAAFPAAGAVVELARDSNGGVMYTEISFNNKLTHKLEGDELTIYLERSGGTLVTGIDEVEAYLKSPPLNARLTASLDPPVPNPPDPLYSAPAAQALNSYMSMTPSDPYTLAFKDYAVPGAHNDVTWSIQNVPGAAKGEAGNALSVKYNYAFPPEQTSQTTAYMSGSATMVITLGTSGAAYLEAYAQAYENPASPTYHQAGPSYVIARQAAVTTSAFDAISAVAALSSAENFFRVAGSLTPGNSGLGLLTEAPAVQLAEGYDQPALFRVSQDGGKTWGPPQSFPASEFQNSQFYNSQLGHASLTTSIQGEGNDVVFTANYMGTWGDDVRVEYRNPNAPNQEAKVTVGPQSWNVCVTLGTDAMGRVTTTANDIVKMVNNHPEAGQLVTASLANYHEGGSGIVAELDCSPLATPYPYEISDVTRITPLGHATAEVRFSYAPPDVKSPDLLYQAIEHGNAGNSVGVRYTVSADSTLYPDAEFQDRVSVSYEEKPNGDKIAVVHLATVSLPSCPDADSDRAAYDAWRALYPVYSCTSSRSVTSTAGDVLEALVAKNLESPGSALVWASMEFKDEGWDSTAKVGPTAGTVWLSGGDDGVKAGDYGRSLRFIPDGTAIQTGDVFQVGVGWYHGDGKDLEVNVMSGYRTDINVTGGGAPGRERLPGQHHRLDPAPLQGPPAQRLRAGGAGAAESPGGHQEAHHDRDQPRHPAYPQPVRPEQPGQQPVRRRVHPLLHRGRRLHEAHYGLEERPAGLRGGPGGYGAHHQALAFELHLNLLRARRNSPPPPETPPARRERTAGSSGNCRKALRPAGKAGPKGLSPSPPPALSGLRVPARPAPCPARRGPARPAPLSSSLRWFETWGGKRPGRPISTFTQPSGRRPQNFEAYGSPQASPEKETGIRATPAPGASVRLHRSNTERSLPVNVKFSLAG
jgi:flagellin-like hook-associated protein FlgL